MNVAPCGKSLTIGHINKSGMHWMFMPWRRDRMKKLIVMSSPNGGATRAFPSHIHLIRGSRRSTRVSWTNSAQAVVVHLQRMIYLLVGG